jgi:hypothetical protein
MFKFLALVILATAFSAPPPARAQADMRQLSVQQQQVYQAGGSPTGSLRLEAQFDRPDPLYAAGEQVRIMVKVNEDAYVTIVNVGPSGQAVQLFPNEHQRQNLVRAGSPVQVPAPGTPAQIVVSPPFGNELVKVVATSAPKGLVPNSQLSGMGAFRSIDGEEFVRNLTSATAGLDMKVAHQNLVLRTVAQLPGAPPATAAAPAAQQAQFTPAQAQQPGQPAPAGGSPAASLLPTLNNPFLLFVATDKSTYRVGERISLAVTSLAACSLTVFDVGANGQARMIFPNRTVSANAIPATQLTMISGGSSPVVVDARGPAGAASLIAVCSTDPSPATVIAPDQTNVFTMIPSAEGLKKDLAQVAARPAGSTSISTISINIQP